MRIETPRVFMPLLEKARYKGAHGGRGGGKSHFFADYCIEAAIMQPGLRILCVREIQKSLDKSSKQLIEDKIVSHQVGRYFGVQAKTITIHGGGYIDFIGLQDHTVDSIKSYEGVDIVWIEEGQSITDRGLELLKNTIRKDTSEILVGWNPCDSDDPIEQLLRGTTPPKRSIIVEANYYDNPWFPAALEEERQHDYETKPDRYGHIWLGHYQPQALGALWTRGLLHKCRVTAAPAMERIIVAIDPAVTESGGDEHGIVVVGKTGDACYLLEDGSLRGAPHEWAQRAITLYDKYDADCVLIERNQGGDMCRNTLRIQRPSLPVREVVASRGKHVRAEPISALYAVSRAYHVGNYPELEAQMCMMTAAGYAGKDSPDRLDALVWGMTHLTGTGNTVKLQHNHKPIVKRQSSGWMSA